MTALATLPAQVSSQGQNLLGWVDPFLVHSWAEFSDPSLAMRWLALAHANGFMDARLGHRQYLDDARIKREIPGGRLTHEAWLMLHEPKFKSNALLHSSLSRRI